MGARKRWIGPVVGAAALAVSAAACVTVVRTYEVAFEVMVPCEAWPDTEAGDTFDVEVVRAAAVVYDLNTLGVTCRTEAEETVSCGDTVSALLELGFLPEWVGVRVTRSDGSVGYAVQRVIGAGHLDLAMGPGLNDWVQADYCRDVAFCLFGEDAVDYCAGLAQPFEEASPTPAASPTPTVAPTATPSPTPAP